MRVWFVLLVPQIVQLRTLPVLSDLRERSIEMKDLTRAIGARTGPQEASPVVRGDNRIEQAPLCFITNTRKQCIPPFHVVTEIASPIRRRQGDVVIGCPIGITEVPPNAVLPDKETVDVVKATGSNWPSNSRQLS
jgi:hypothetical protein